jgi:hypothetical protein
MAIIFCRVADCLRVQIVRIFRSDCGRARARVSERANGRIDRSFDQSTNRLNHASRGQKLRPTEIKAAERRCQPVFSLISG